MKLESAISIRVSKFLEFAYILPFFWNAEMSQLSIPTSDLEEAYLLSLWKSIHIKGHFLSSVLGLEWMLGDKSKMAPRFGPGRILLAIVYVRVRGGNHTSLSRKRNANVVPRSH